VDLFILENFRLQAFAGKKMGDYSKFAIMHFVGTLQFRFTLEIETGASAAPFEKILFLAFSI
jgi:hypothetical protein